MRAILSPAQFVDDYLVPIWEWFTDMFYDFQKIFTTNRISTYIMYLILLDVLILPFVFWLTSSFILSYRNKKVSFVGVSYLKDIRCNLSPIRPIGHSNKFLGTFTGSTKYIGSSPRYIGALGNRLSGSLGSKINGSPINSRVTGTLTGSLGTKISGSPINSRVTGTLTGSPGTKISGSPITNRLSGPVSSRISGSAFNSRVSGSLSTRISGGSNFNRFSGSGYRLGLMPYSLYSNKFLRYNGGLIEYRYNSDRAAFLKASMIGLKYDTTSGTNSSNSKYWHEVTSG